MTDADAEVDVEDLVHVRECVCGGEIEIDPCLGLGLLGWPGGVIAGVGRLPTLAVVVGAVVGRKISAGSVPLCLIVGLRGPMGRVRSRRENEEVNDDDELNWVL